MEPELNLCPVNIQERTATILTNHCVRLILVKLGGSYLLVVNDEGDVETLKNLSLAIASSTTNIMGSDQNRVEQSLAQKLSTRFNKNGPFYVSFNCCLPPVKSSEFLLEIEMKIVEFLSDVFYE